MDLTPEVTFGVLSDIKRVVQESKLVLWVNAISTELAFQAMGLGVRGILRQTSSADLQVKCLQKVHEGELWFEKALTDRFLAAKRVVLSPREGQLVTLLSHGLKNKEIASTLQISEGTVKVYLSRLFQKLVAGPPVARLGPAAASSDAAHLPGSPSFQHTRGIASGHPAPLRLHAPLPTRIRQLPCGSMIQFCGIPQPLSNRPFTSENAGNTGNVKPLSFTNGSTRPRSSSILKDRICTSERFFTFL